MTLNTLINFYRSCLRYDLNETLHKLLLSSNIDIPSNYLGKNKRFIPFTLTIS